MTPTALKPQRRAILVLLAAAALLTSGCVTDFDIRTALPPEAATTQGQVARDVYLLVFFIGVAIFIFVQGLILYAAIRYRRRQGDNALPPQIHGNDKLEIAWTAIPLAIVLGLFVVSWQALGTIDAHEEDPEVRIGVVAFQWQWQFVYPPEDLRWQDCALPENRGRCVTIIGLPPPGGDRTNWEPPTMYVPVNETVELHMHSPDVIHSFYVPAFLYQRDITPRRDQVIQFHADRQGTFRGKCTQFCGLLHHVMEFQVRVVTRDEFDTWLAAQLAPAATPTPTPAAGGYSGPGGWSQQSATIEPRVWPAAFGGNAYDMAAPRPVR
jgi:cytochrome c oxidase subunit 2